MRHFNTATSTEYLLWTPLRPEVINHKTIYVLPYTFFILWLGTKKKYIRKITQNEKKAMSNEFVDACYFLAQIRRSGEDSWATQEWKGKLAFEEVVHSTCVTIEIKY